jgi:hypothetical protein
MRENSEENILFHGSDYRKPLMQQGYPKRTRDQDGRWMLEERFLYPQ